MPEKKGDQKLGKEHWSQKGWEKMLSRQKMTISIENAGMVTVEDKFPCAICRKDVDRK